MKNIVHSYVRKFREERRKSHRAVALLLALALVVSTGVSWQLHATGIALTNETYCGLEEHTHTEDCYEEVLVCGQEESEGHTHTDACYETETTLVCGREESEGHTHSDDCYDEDGNLICGKEESEGHTHTDACYETEKVLVCGQEESTGHTHTDACYEEQLTCGKEEHTHTVDCLTDETADVETAADWEATLPTLTGVWGTDVAAVAKSQLGYTESTANFTLADDGETRQGYTRYGAWYGNEYGDWDAMFASFCLYYAGVDEDAFPQNSGVYAWTVTLNELGLYDADAEPTNGDLVFFDTDKDGKADHVGVVAGVSDYKVTVIEGDKDGKVQSTAYSLNDSTITGYGVLAEQEETEAEAEETETTTLTYEGEDYTVTATYGEDAELPEDVELVATEYAKDSENYLARYAEAAELYGWSEDEDYTDSFRLFCIGFYVDGEEVEPAAEVQVTITYLNQENEVESYTVTHYGDEGTETLENETAYADGAQTTTFASNSFSQYSLTAGGGQSGGGLNPGGQTSPSTIYVWYDTVTVNTSTNPASLTAKDSTAGISKITLDGSEVPHGNGGSSDYRSSTSGLAISNAYSTSGRTVSITVTPADGYYITFISVNCCGSGAATNCETYGAGGAYTSSFTVSSAGAITRSVTLDATNGFHHDSNASNYFILIGVAPIPSPLYVEYDYGDIKTYIDDSNYTSDSSAFRTADGWTTTSNRGNSYGTGSVQTDDTQYQYAYTSTGTDADDAALANQWKHYANTITDDAKKQAAAAGYVFAGWKAEYYTKVTVTSQTASASEYQYAYNNYVYNFDSSYGTATYNEDDAVALTTNVRLIAQWIPIGITLTKTVSGLPTDYSESTTYGFTVYYRASNTDDWTEYTIASLSVAGNGSASTIIYPAVSGQYMVTETSGNSDLPIDGTTYYITVNSDGTVTVDAPPTSWTTQTVDDTVAVVGNLTVTNSYTETAPTASVILKKISSTSTGTEEVTLSGAAFTLTDSDENTVVDKLTTGDDGTVPISDLSVNATYTLKEIAAPNGYNLLTDSITFTVSSTGEVKTESNLANVTTSADDDGNTVYTITITNEPGTVLPSTGGSGTWLYTLAGLTLCGGAALVLFRRKETE